MHQISFRVYYEDTDLAGIVYHANYLKFFERGRSEAVRSVGIDQKALLADQQLVFAVRDMTIQFLRPAEYDDLLLVQTEFAAIKGASITLHQRILRDDCPIVTAKLRLAMLNAAGQPARLPKDLRNKLVIT